MEEVKSQEAKIVIQTPEGNGLATAALVLGIIGLVIGIIPFVGWLVFPLWILAIIFGAIGARKKIKKGQAIAGIVLGTGTFVLKVGFWILMLIGIASGS
ncbi:hypothetical protein [Salinithrix halophila]|uniref:DUF4190 domain-containing protein n=1 Tax=Salinithrix halophila TaxID=1485204 RepID=A0ABV8JA87_9BACL